MGRIRLAVAAGAVAAAMVLACATPGVAQEEESPFPFCGWFYTEGDVGVYRSHGVALYSDDWYGWHRWCESPSSGWYVID